MDRRQLTQQHTRALACLNACRDWNLLSQHLKQALAGQREMGQQDRRAFRHWIYEVLRWTTLLDTWLTELALPLTWQHRTQALAAGIWGWEEDDFIPAALLHSVKKFRAQQNARRTQTNSLEFIQSYGFSRDWAERWIEVFPEHLERLMETLAEPPHPTVLAPQGSLSTDQFQRARYSQFSYHVTPEGESLLHRLPSTVRVQDEGSSLIAALAASTLPPKEEKTCLDLCAGSGGKSFALRLFLPHVRITVWDGPRYALTETCLSWPRTERLPAEPTWGELEQSYDLVLIDAPCSRSGTVQRHPELRLFSPHELMTPYLHIQAELLDRAAGLTRAGGNLIYATCSVFREENEEQIAAFLSRNPHFVRKNWERSDFTGVTPAFIKTYPPPYSSLQLRPETSGPSGFFMARLQRKADTVTGVDFSS